MAEQTTPLDEMLKVARDVAKARGDSFRVKLMKRNGAALPTPAVTLDNATVEHLASPETWVPQLVGGGNYSLMIYELNSDSPGSVNVGPAVPLQISGPAIDPPNTSALDAADWRGPKTLLYPAARVAAHKPQEMGLNGYVPAAPGAPVAPGGQMPAADPEQVALLAKQRQLDAERMTFERGQTRREAEERIRETESRAQMQLREVQERAREEKREVMAKLAALEAAPKTSLAQEVMALAAPLVPLYLEYLKQQRETEARAREEQAKREERNEERRLRSEAAMAERQAKAEERMMTMMMKMAEPKNDHIGDAYRTMAEGQSAMSNMMVNVVSSMVDMGLAGPQRSDEPSPMVQVAREGIKVVGAFLSQQKPPRPPAAPAPAPVAVPRLAAVPTPPPVVAQVADSEGESVIGAMAAMFEGKKPAAEIAQYLLAHATDDDAELQNALIAAGGDFAQVMIDALPDGWLDEEGSRPYLLAVVELVIQEGVKTNVIPAMALDELPKIRKDILGEVVDAVK